LNNRQEFKKLFDSFYPALYLFAMRIVKDRFHAEDLVQEVFIKLWEKAGEFKTTSAARSYLYTSVRNKCLNHLEHNKVIKKHEELAQRTTVNSSGINNLIIEEETHRLIYKAINELPAQCKNVLLLSMNGLKNSEIAGELNITVNTVKTQKKIAYKQLRIKLQNIYSFVVLLVGSIF
jgi:RNA polymerase sigma-70 factor (ECF subfamily)